MNQYSFLTFLSAYLNQVDLSLDRSRWDSIKRLQNYYKTQIKPQKLANYIISLYKLDSNKLKDIYFINEYNWFDRTKIFMERICCIPPSLSIDEAYFICQKLYVLDEFLKGVNEVHKLELEKLRIDIANFNSSIMRTKISSKEWNKVRKIEHYLQNEILDCIKINEFVPDDF